MILSTNTEPQKELFREILGKSIDILNGQAIADPVEIKKLAGIHLEQHVADIMAELSIGTVFEKTIHCLGGISFPDIIANKYYGVEVKTTIKNHWKTTGNSVLETTRRQDVERIFLLFGKLGDPVEFRYRAYEECLSEVVVTHSPRYLIDMNLAADNTIFDKIKIPYDELRRKSNPIRPIVNYYKSLLKEGEELWWVEPTDSHSVSLVIKLWSNLSVTEKKNYTMKGFCLFPELLGSSHTKFNRLAIWLSISQGIVCPNLRDPYSAGGRVDLLINNKKYIQVPAIFGKLQESKREIVQFISDDANEELFRNNELFYDSVDRLSAWKSLATQYSKKILDSNYYDLIPDLFF